ncbi:MAG: DUF3641 domain-containing protein, partial [Gammaproteobacteria bacterium]|nr:DUF3641 domain-containing protein [Gammaproteobacteria bacterium]
YKKQLFDRHGIVFNHLYSLTNMPIKRFGSTLLSHHQFDDYMHLLKSSHQQANLNTVMCSQLISIDWQGYVYDCDFNQMLELPLIISDRQKSHITELMSENIKDNPIMVADHCYGCTAGQGSSCGGALAE